MFARFQGGVGGLVEARLTADSACPGFRDEVEGVYTSAPGFAPWRYGGQCTPGYHLSVDGSCVP